MKDETKTTTKKKPNRQHAAKGQAFIELAEKLRDLAYNYPNTTTTELLHLIANAAEEVGKATRAKR